MTVTEEERIASSLAALAESGLSLSVRDFIIIWRSKGRGTQVVDAIRRDLKSLQLTTEPPFEYGTLDSLISVVPLQGEISRDRSRFSTAQSSASPTTEIDENAILHVGQIPSALGGITSLPMGASIGRAQTLMIRHDYSQLAVTSNDELIGVVSWESIAQTALKKSIRTLAECMFAPITLGQDADLLASLPIIVAANFVVVLDPKGSPSGLVTTADLASQFDRLARPFLMVGECERELRSLLDRYISAEDLYVLTRYKDPAMPGASAMTIGDIKKVFSHDDHWKKIGLRLSQNAFIEWLEVVRRLRNDIAHFNQDDESLTPALAEVKNLTQFLRRL